MATKVGEAYLELTARNAKLKTKMQESEKAGRSFTQRMQASLVKFGKVAFVGAIAGFTALTAIMTKATKAAAAEEVQTVRLTHQMGRLGVATQKNVARVEALAAKLQDFTRFGDTETRKVLSILMTLSNDFEASLKNVGLAFDIAESGMFDVRTAARYIGLALTGNVEILGRYVAELKTSTNEQLKFMSSSEKAAFAITLLNQKFGGLAKQIGDTTAGAWAKLANAISDAWEALGAGMLDETSGGLERVTKAVKKTEPALNKMGQGFSRVLAFAISKGNDIAEVIEAAAKTIAGLWQDQGEIQRAETLRAEAEHISKIKAMQVEAMRKGKQNRDDAIDAELSAERKAAAIRSQDAQKWTALQEKEEAIVEAAKERALKNEKRRAGIRETLRKKALADQIALWREEAEARDRIVEGTESKRLAALAEQVSLWRAEAEEIDRMVKARAPKEVRRQEPAFVGAEQLWKRAMTMGDTPDIREQKKHTTLLESIYGATKENTEAVRASSSGLVE